MSGTTLIVLSPEQLQEQLQACAERAVQRFIDASKEPPVPKEIIMQRKGIKDAKTFYKLRRKRGAQEVVKYGNVPFYNYSDFI